MARSPRVRDYKAEYARRKARAQALGFRSPYHATKSRFDTELQQWSDRKSAREVSQYDPDWSYKKKRAYYNAWIRKERGVHNINAVRTGKGDRQALRHWMVNITGHYTAADFDRRYPM